MQAHLLAAITVMVEKVIELKHFLVASKRSARTGLDLEPGEVLMPNPTSPHTSTSARRA